MRKFLLATALFLSISPAWAAGDAGDPVRTLDTALLAAMKAGKEAGFQARSALVGPAVDQAFDLPEMARLTLGSIAKTLTPDQMTILAKAFRDYSVANYAANFDGFSGERFDQSPPRQNGTLTVIPTRLVPPNDGRPVQLDYVVHQVDGQWKISDVLAEGGASQAASNRADFKPILTSQGFDALISAINAKTKTLSQQK